MQNLPEIFGFCPFLPQIFPSKKVGDAPGQPYALPVIVWVKTAELLIGRAPRDAAVMPKEDSHWMPLDATGCH